MIKKIWTTPNVHDSVSITFESDMNKGKLSIRELIFPDKQNYSLERHTIVLTYFTPEDINKLAQCLDKIRTD